MVDPSSRYSQIDEAIYEDASGRRLRYKKRRFLPQGLQMPLLVEVTVVAGDRLDLIATRTLGVPDQFWRICDANNALNPFDLTDEIGSTVRVSPPQF